MDYHTTLLEERKEYPSIQPIRILGPGHLYFMGRRLRLIIYYYYIIVSKLVSFRTRQPRREPREVSLGCTCQIRFQFDELPSYVKSEKNLFLFVVNKRHIKRKVLRSLVLKSHACLLFVYSDSRHPAFKEALRQTISYQSSSTPCSQLNQQTDASGHFSKELDPPNQCSSSAILTDSESFRQRQRIRSCSQLPGLFKQNRIDWISEIRFHPNPILLSLRGTSYILHTLLSDHSRLRVLPEQEEHPIRTQVEEADLPYALPTDTVDSLRNKCALILSEFCKNNNREHETFVDIIQELTLKNKISEGDELSREDFIHILRTPYGLHNSGIVGIDGLGNMKS